MNPTTTTAARRAARTLISGSSTTSTRASSSSAAAPTQSRRAPRKTLRSLVELHHKAASFLPDTKPETIAKGFHAAFRYSSPVWAPYVDPPPYAGADKSAFSREVRERQAERGIGGIEEYRLFDLGSGAKIGKRETAPPPVRALRGAWMGAASFMDAEKNATLTAREARVQEALHGTWNRGAAGGGKEVGLEGVEEFAEARGESIGWLSKAWIRRHHD